MDILDLLMKQRDSLIRELGVYTEMCSKLAFDNLAPINKRINTLRYLILEYDKIIERRLIEKFAGNGLEVPSEEDIIEKHQL